MNESINLFKNLEKVILEGDLSGLEYLANSEEFDSYETLPCGLPWLHYACSLGQLATAKWLVEYGEDVDRYDDNLPTPLFIAASHGHSHLIHFLTNLDVDIDFTYEKFDSYGNFIYGSNPVAVSLHNKHFGTTDLLLEKGASGNVEHIEGGDGIIGNYIGTNFTPALHMALDYKNYYLMRRLLKCGADPDAKIQSSEGFGPNILGYSLIKKDYSALELLLNENISPDIKFEKSAGMNDYPFLPVEYAIIEKDWRAYDILLNYSPNLDLRCEEGWKLSEFIATSVNR